MQIASSARRTCIASESAVECTATVLMPISWQARWMRSAISPRLAIRSFLISGILFFLCGAGPPPHPATHRILPLGGRMGERAGAAQIKSSLLDNHEGLGELDRLAG